MALSTFSLFYYGHEITVLNNQIPFDEGGGELSAEISVGYYSLNEFVTAVQSALNDAGTLTYTVSVNRATRIITIAGSATFSLLFNTGVTADVSCYELLGFAASDFTSASFYVATLQSGYEYEPQFLLQDYMSKDDNLDLIDAVVNKSASGRVQVIRFGNERFFKMNIKFITDLIMDDIVIKNNPTGVTSARNFMDTIVKKGTFEFMPDRATTSTYYKVILDQTTADKAGLGYELKELVNQNLPGIYETGLLKLRYVE